MSLRDHRDSLNEVSAFINSFTILMFQASNVFCFRQSHCCGPVLVRMPEEDLVFSIIPFPHFTPTFPE